MTTPADLTDAEITALLQSVVDDRSILAPNKASIRGQMLSEHAVPRDDRSNVIDLTGHVSNVGAVDHSRPPKRSWVGFAAVAACIIVAVGALSVWRSTDEAPLAPSETVPLPTEPLFRSIDRAATPSRLPAGTYVSSLAGGVTFELEEPVTLLERSDRQVTLALSGTDDVTSTVSLVGVDPGEYRSTLSAAVKAGDVRPDTAAYRDDGLRLEVTTQGADAWDCQPLVDCQVGDLPFAIAVNMENFVTPIEFDSGAGLVMIERSRDPIPAPQTVARVILDTIEP